MEKHTTRASASEGAVSSQLQELKCRLDGIAAEIKLHLEHSSAGVLSDMSEHHRELETRLAELRSNAAVNSEAVRQTLANQVEKLANKVDRFHQTAARTTVTRSRSFKN